MSLRRIVPLGSILLLGLLAACNLGGSTPTCTVEQLVPPDPSAPGHYSQVTGATTTPLVDELFAWTYPEDCTPEHFKLLFSADRHFGIARSGMSDGELAWPVPGEPPQMALEPATEYFWRVRAWTGGVNGPDSVNRVFFTGPFCSSVGELGAPELLSPADGATVSQLSAELHYRPGGTPCVPEGYFVDLQTDPTFGGATLLGAYGIPGTYVLTDPLVDSSTYYWRVAPIYDGVQGPFSETWSFSVEAPLSRALPDLEVAAVDLLSIFCGPEDLVPPEPIAPGHYSYVGDGPTIGTLTPELFQWDGIGCVPDHYKLLFSTDRHFGMARSGMTDGELVWPSAAAEFPQLAIEPASEYFWNVRAWTDGLNGPASATRVFFTGPQCASPAELVAPEQLSPDEGEVIATEFAELHYQPGEPACLPEGYALNLQTDPGFGGVNLLGSYGLPGTYVLTEPLDDCTTYHWQVAAIVEGSEGPFSPARSLRTDFLGTFSLPMLGGPFIEGLRDIPCYSGPDPRLWGIHGYLMGGEQAALLGQDMSGDWWVIDNPDDVDHCFVRKTDTMLVGEIDDLMVWRDPPLPITPTPTTVPLACHEKLTQSQCLAAGGTWVPQVTAPSYCDCP
jgi:hypothetical protein